MTTTLQKNVLVIGGGVTGLCSAFYLLKSGHSVTLVERHARTADSCSLGNAGLVVPSHVVPLAAPGMIAMGLKWMLNPESPFYIKPRLNGELIGWLYHFWRSANSRHVDRSAPLLAALNLASRQAFQDLVKSGDVDCGLQTRGLLMLCQTQKALDEEAHTAARAEKLGLKSTVLDAAGVARREPDIRTNAIGAVHFEDDCHLSPSAFVTSLRATCENLGLQTVWETTVNRLSGSAGRITTAHTDAGKMTADAFVVAGGAWSPRIVDELGVSLPMQAGKGYSITLKNPPRKPSLPMLLTEARVAVTPMPEGLRFAGTMEIAGLNSRINTRRIAGIAKSVPRFFPEFSPEDLQTSEPWCGLRPCSPDGLPYIGPFAKWGNLFTATGHAMMGLSLGPITGKIIADLISGTPQDVPMELLRPDRFGG